MALIGPPGFDLQRMREEVRRTYDRLADDPASMQHVHTGLDHAVERLGYDRAELDLLPRGATERFAGVGNPHRLGPAPPGAVVLDVGCGAGMDLLLAARQAGAGSRVIGVDPSRALRSRARDHAAQAGLLDRVDVRPGLAEELPLGASSVDHVQTNGVLNLVGDKVRAFAEIHRVLRPGGVLHLADVLLDVDLHEHERMDPHLWAS